MPYPRNRRRSEISPAFQAAVCEPARLHRASAYDEAPVRDYAPASSPAPKRWAVVFLGAASALALAASCSSLPRTSEAEASASALPESGAARPSQDTTRPTVPASATDGPTAFGAPANAHARYPNDAVHSPLTRSVVARLSSMIGAENRRDVFAKIGDSNTVNVNALQCFAGRDVHLEGRDALQPTIDHFRRTMVDATHDSFDRMTLAAKVGWTTSRVLAGVPSPLAQEIDALRPAFAMVLLGTNDTAPWRVEAFEKDLQQVVSALVVRGVVPTLTTIPPRGDTKEAVALVPEMNAVVKVVAQANQIPLIDPWSPVLSTPGRGLAGDGVHLQVFSEGVGRGCWFSDEALRQGMNARNLATLEALDRLRRTVVLGQTPDPDTEPLAGDGTWQRPYQVDSLPFVDDGDTATRANVESFYPCGTQEQADGEVVYLLNLAEPMALRLRVFTAEGVDLDVHWLDGPLARDCAARGDKSLEVHAGAGLHRLVVDGPRRPVVDTVGRAPRVSPYRLTVVRID